AEACPRLALLLGGVPLELSVPLALRTVGVSPVRRVALAPEVLQASLIVRELGQEFAQRVERVRGLCPDGILAVCSSHYLPLSVEAASDGTATMGRRNGAAAACLGL